MVHIKEELEEVLDRQVDIVHHRKRMNEFSQKKSTKRLFMSDTELVCEIFLKILEATGRIEQRFSTISSPDDLLSSKE